MAAAARAFLCSFVTDLSLKHHPPPPPVFLHLISRPSVSSPKRRPSAAVVSCLVSGVDGGGVSDDFVSTRKSGFDREFFVIANMLKRIEPLDTAVISKGVSDSAKDSMKQTISSMLGLLPSDQFSVTVRVSKRPLDHLLVSSIITGYTLWNAEYRISLMRNFDISPDSLRSSNSLEPSEVSESGCNDGGDCEVSCEGCVEDVECLNLQNFGDLSAEATDYIKQLQSELSNVKKELNEQKEENMQMEYKRRNNNDLLKYLRSLEAHMVSELSRPSSIEVEEIIHQLVENLLRRFFKDESTSDFMGVSVMGSTENYQNSDDDSIVTSRDYLAKLLFWCMLMGHHLRGLENRLHLSCAVGLL